PARLPDLDRRRGALPRPRGRRSAGPLPWGCNSLLQALQPRPADPRLLRPEGRAAGRGRAPDGARPPSRRRAAGRPDGARRGRPRAVVAERRALAGGAGTRPRAPPRARDPRPDAGP